MDELEMKIKVVIDNTPRIEEALNRANGGAYAHVASVQDVFALAKRGELSLTDRGLPAGERIGAEVCWQGKGALAKAYDNKMNRTQLTLVRGGSGYWFLTKG